MEERDGRFLLSHKDKKDDDLIAFIYYKYVNELFIWGKTFTSETELIRDSIQDLFIYFLDNKGKLDSIQNLRVYLFCSLRHNIIRNLNNKPGYDTNSFLENSEPTIEDGLINEEITHSQKKFLKEAFRSLSKRQKRVIFLRYKLQMEYDEICKVLDINYQSARTLVYRAINKMKETYQIIKIL